MNVSNLLYSEIFPLIVSVDWDQYRVKTTAHLAYGRPAGLSDEDGGEESDSEASDLEDPNVEGLLEIYRGNGYYEIYECCKDGTRRLVDNYIYH